MTETPGPSNDRPPLSGRRWIIAIVGGIFMLFGGGAALLYLGLAVLGGAGDKDVILVLAGIVFGVVPFLLGFIIWWPAVYWKR